MNTPLLTPSPLNKWLHTSASRQLIATPILTILIYSVFRGPMGPNRWGYCVLPPTENLSHVQLPGVCRERSTTSRQALDSVGLAFNIAWHGREWFHSQKSQAVTHTVQH